MITIGTLVVIPDRGYARVFANYGSSIGVELVQDHRLVWVAEKVVRAEEEPGEEEVAHG